MLSNEDYEDAYREALLCLREIAYVGEPYRTATGTRSCQVDEAYLDDYQVFTRIWGDQVGDRIRRERSLTEQN